MSTGASDANAGSSSKERPATAIEQKAEEIKAKLNDIEKNRMKLEEEGQRLEGEAREIDGQIRALTQQEADLQKSKRQLEQQARTVGERRNDTTARHKKLIKERESLLAELEKLDSRKDEIEKQRAFDESQKQAAIQKQEKSKDPDAPENRRSHPRFSVEVDITLHTVHNFYTGITENISEGGLFIATFEHLPVGTSLDLTVSLPDHPPIQVQAVVRWVREYNQFTSEVSPGIGVQFSDLKEKDQKAIERFIKGRAPLLYEAS